MGLAGGIQQHARMSRELMRIFDGAAAASARRRSLSSSRMASQGLRLSDFVGGAVHLLVADFGGIDAVVGHEHALESIEDEQPRPLAWSWASRFCPSAPRWASFSKFSSGWPVM